MALYTDGSSNYKDKSGGWAYVAADAFGNQTEGWGAETDATNNRMEMTAVIRGLLRLAADYGECEVLVRSDSQYVVLGCQDPSRSRKKNTDLWWLLDTALLGHSYVEFEHVKGHEGEHFNERCDVLAGEARKGQR
ncbi:ribonuclease H family protein [Candidatus Solirubrobacter pratensis]|uniref:ribonuclease H family protein n=1 Tax=Candidatus Solirubrobacter pratensis TaxID=1298857 RepID=UPI0018CBB9EF|nr:ribonuclease H [Candidatus Solirubrobacter pratensis]